MNRLLVAAVAAVLLSAAVPASAAADRSMNAGVGGRSTRPTACVTSTQGKRATTCPRLPLSFRATL